MSIIDNYKNAEVPTTSFEPLPKGNYTAVVDNVVVNVAEEKVEWTFQISEGEFKNRKVFRNIPLQQDWGLGALKQDIQALKLDDSAVAKVEDFGPVLYGTMNKKLKIHVTQTVSKKNGKTYNNAYINGWFNEAEGITAMDANEEVPF